MRRGMPACKGGNLAAVSAGRHGTPAAAMRAGLVVEEEPALGIGANSERRLWTLGDKFRRRTGNGSQQPIQAAFARDEFHAPGAVFENQLVMSFGDPQDFVDGLDPFPCDLMFSMHGRQGLTKRGGQAPGLQEQSFCCRGIRLRQSEKLGSAFRGDDAGGLQEKDESLPGKLRVGRSRVDEVKAEPAAK